MRLHWVCMKILAEVWWGLKQSHLFIHYLRVSLKKWSLYFWCICTRVMRAAENYQFTICPFFHVCLHWSRGLLHLWFFHHKSNLMEFFTAGYHTTVLLPFPIDATLTHSYEKILYDNTALLTCAKFCKDQIIRMLIKWNCRWENCQWNVPHYCVYLWSSCP